MALEVKRTRDVLCMSVPRGNFVYMRWEWIHRGCGIKNDILSTHGDAQRGQALVSSERPEPQVWHALLAGSGARARMSK